MKILDIETLNELPPDEVFAKGVVLDGQPYFNFDGKQRILKWVAMTGGIGDWTVYVALNEKSYYETVGWGDKVQSEEYIRYLVPCTDEAYKKYRH